MRDEVPAAGGHTGRRYSWWVRWAIELASRAHIAILRRGGGRGALVRWLYRRFTGGELEPDRPAFLLLTTVGRRSGRPRTKPLLYLPRGGDLVVVGSYGGSAQHPAWALNLLHTPLAEVQVGRRRWRVRAEVATGEERATLWSALLRLYPPYRAYQERTTREIPLFVLKPVAR